MKIKKIILILTMAISLILPLQINARIVTTKPTQDSEQLRLQDMLMQFLIPNIRESVSKYYYPNVLNVSPDVEPWHIDVISTQRMNGFRGFILQVTIEVQPSVGHHVPVGKDRIIFQISYGHIVKIVNYNHLETYQLPLDLQEEFGAKS